MGGDYHRESETQKLTFWENCERCGEFGVFQGVLLELRCRVG
jgi:hypothetical protein